MIKTPSGKYLLLASLVLLVSMACSITIPLAPGNAPPALPTSNPAEEPVRNTSQDSTPIPTIASTPMPTLAPIQVPAALTNEEAVLTQLYQRANPAVVNIVTYANRGNVTAPTGQGSGWLYDNQGHIVTNSHVVHGSDSVDIIFSNNSTVTAEVVGEDLNSDLAVLRVGSLPDGVQALPLADISSVAVGQTVIAIGNPFGLGGTLTRGVVSALGRTIPALTAFSIPQAIQTDAPINPGNSGGPLLNLKGEVIGVNAQIETGGESRSNSGIGFAIPVSIVSRVVPELIANGEYEWSWMGVVGGTISPALIEAMDLPVDRGAYIAEVVRGGPADKAGLRGARRQASVNGRVVEIGGDVIIAVDGQPVASFEDILIYIALNTTPGQRITLTIIRDGEQTQVPLTLEPRPVEQEPTGFSPN